MGGAGVAWDGGRGSPNPFPTKSMRLCAPTRDGASRPLAARRGGVRAGFSITELLITLTIMGVLAVIVVPNIAIWKFRMDGQTRGFVAALISAQRSAVQRQHDVAVIFDTTLQQLRLHEDEDNDGVVDAGERVRLVALDDGVRFGRGSAPARTATSTAAISFTEVREGLPAVRFRRNGSASEEGTFYLTSPRSGMTEYASDSRAIQVDRATGRTSWYYYQAPTWQEAH